MLPPCQELVLECYKFSIMTILFPSLTLLCHCEVLFLSVLVNFYLVQISLPLEYWCTLRHKKNNKLHCQKLDSFMSRHENCVVQVKVARTTASVSETCNSLIRYMAYPRNIHSEQRCVITFSDSKCFNSQQQPAFLVQHRQITTS